MWTVKAARTALERQVWESVQIDRLSLKGDTCLNLKTERGSTNTPSLENKARPSATHSQQQKDQGMRGGRKRGEYEENRGGNQQQPPPAKRRNMDQGEEPGIGEALETSGQGPEDREKPETEAPMTETGASTPVSVKVRRLEMINKPQEQTGGKSGPLGSPGGPKRLIQPTLGTFMWKRSGLEGSLRQQKEEKPSTFLSLGTGGRDLKAQPNTGTKGRIGEKRKGGRIWGPSSGLGPMDKYLERENRTLSSKDVTSGALGNRLRQQGVTKEGGSKDRTPLEREGEDKKVEEQKPDLGKERGSRSQRPQ